MTARKVHMTCPLTLICGLCVCLGTLGQADAKELEIRFHRQHTVVWCWAATIAMVVEYATDQSIEDCQVLSMYDESLGGPGECCQDLHCVRTGSTQEMADILGNVFDIHGGYLPSPISFSQVRNHIDNDRPLIAGLRGGPGAHVVVISGYRSPFTVIVLDPLSGRHEVDWGALIVNAQFGHWTETFVIGLDEPFPETSWEKILGRTF